MLRRSLEYRVAGLFIRHAQVAARARQILVAEMLAHVLNPRLSYRVHGDGVLQDVRVQLVPLNPRLDSVLLNDAPEFVARDGKQASCSRQDSFATSEGTVTSTLRNVE